MIKYVIYIGVVLLSLICTEVNAQNRDFGGLNRYAQENKNVPILGKNQSGLSLWETPSPKGG